jgi:hypothetical protein
MIGGIYYYFFQLCKVKKLENPSLKNGKFSPTYIEKTQIFPQKSQQVAEIPGNIYIWWAKLKFLNNLK